ncbi:type VI secretion system membrane subunit TssM [Porphyrobacter sp. YT40]|uniref:type VI secretion system membrane subunit TssM n=1 Tax=Porphyrobacter sp. YT40 TaxID=2547601 RepID=UPI0011438AC6|nr:type VI secretion system membrane subunit TssM [Porphyrobacter sp. YT40]QDH33049.1 type VI secretion system membrane subunit TssM [Porphyrobacter sp. YT40]
MKKFLTNWWTVSIGTMVLLALLLCLGLPLFVDALKPLWVRLTIAGLLVLAWLAWFLLRRRAAKKAEAALAAELAGPDAAGEEAGAVQGRMAAALKQLREAGGGKRGYLYAQPWYVIIGPPGAGKTTALMNSGLRFPLADRTLQGTGGTRNLDFLFAEEAVLVDTAGRYTTQDSDSAVDNAGWKRLLELLRKHRPFEPVNGILVAIPADDLQRGDVRVIDNHAAIIRRRLREIREALQVELPVYLLITKADLLAGMTEYFADLDVDGRRAVIGHTFPAIATRLESADITAAFDEVTNDVAARQPKRLEEEKDIRRRGLILGFPAQLFALRPALFRLIEGAFLNEDRPSGRLRGFYLTSGTQDGSAIDRILQGVSKTYGSSAAAGGAQEGRAFFLNRLLQEVVFKEAGMPVSDPALERKRQRQITAVGVALAAAVVLAVGLWTVSFLGNRGFQSDTLAAADTIKGEIDSSRLDLVRIGASDASLEQVLPLLDALRDLPEGYQAQADGGPSLFNRFGLFQSSLAQRNAEAYHIGLRRILLPRVMLRLEDKMRAELADPLALYEPLKVYLMLGGAAPGRRIDPDTVRQHVAADWASEVFPGAEMAPVRERLALHLDALTNDPNISAGWAGGKAPLDGELVAAARTAVGSMSLSQRAFAILRAKTAKPEEDFQMATLLQPGDAAAFADPDALLAIRVPYIFTRKGFEQSYAIARADVAQDLKNETWVLGQTTGSIAGELSGMQQGISTIYAQEYIAQWKGVVGALKAADYFNNPQAFRALTKDPSPLRTVLLEVRKNTNFKDPSPLDKAEKLALDKLKQTKVGKIGEKLASGSSASSADGEITMAFADLNAWTGTGQAPGEIKTFIDTVRQTFSSVSASGQPGTGGSAAEALAPVLGELKTAATQAPEIMQGFANGVVEGGSSSGVAVLQGEATLAYSQQVQPACEQAVGDKFPFQKAATTDAAVGEVRATFGPGGLVPQFIQTRLDAYLDRSGEDWRWTEGDPVVASFSPATPKNMQKADALALTIGEGLPLRMELMQLGREANRVELSTGGVVLRFDLDDNKVQNLTWQFGGGMVQSSEVKIIANGGIEGLGPPEQVAWKRPESGPWSLFRLLERARVRAVTDDTVEAEFNPGPARAVFRISFPTDRNPFSGGGLWSVQCPQML